ARGVANRRDHDFPIALLASAKLERVAPVARARDATGMHFGRWAAAGFLCGLGLAACKFSELNEEHCENNEGDATCLARYPDGSRPYCGRGTCFTEVEDGCLAEAPTDDACASPCGGQAYG